jgi:hypothetical protein
MVGIRCANGAEYSVTNVYKSTTFFEGVSRPMLRFDLGDGFESQFKSDLKTGKVQVYDLETGGVLGEYEGFTTISEFAITLVQFQNLEVTVAQLTRQLADMQSSHDAQIRELEYQQQKQLTDMQVSYNNSLEKATAMIRDEFTAKMKEQENLYISNQNALMESHARELEEVMVSARMGLFSTPPTKEDSWIPNMIYLKGDTIRGYIALRLTRNEKPDDNLGTAWAIHVTEEDFVMWENIPDMSTVYSGTAVKYEGENFMCVETHIKSIAFIPGNDPNKWERI